MPAPATSSRHLYTGRHQGHTQAAPWLRASGVARSPLSRGPDPLLGFGAVLKTFDASAVVYTCSSSRHSPDPVSPGLLPKRSPQRLLTAAASGGLGSLPAQRARRANLHHWHSTVHAGGFYVTVTLLSGHTTRVFSRIFLGTLTTWTTITLFGEQQVIIDSEGAMPVAGQTTERQCSIRRQPVADLSGHTHQLTRRSVS